MSLFEPPFEFRYRCRACKVTYKEIRDKLSYVAKPCPRCGKRMEETRHVHMGVKTDSTFQKGWTSDDGFGDDDRARKKARAIARAAGVSPEGKKYFPGLAKRQYDPGAWMSDTHDVRKRCEMEGWGCEGSVTVKPVDIETSNPLDEPYSVDPALVDKEIRTKELLAGERLTKKDRAALKEKLVTSYSGDKD